MPDAMKLGCCADIKYYDLIASCGYDTICLSAAALYAMSDEEFEACKKKISEGPLELIGLNGFYKDGVFLNGPKYSEEILTEYTEKICARGEALGCRYLGIGAPKARNVHEGDDPKEMLGMFKESLRLMCGIASRHGMDILLESVCSAECNLVLTAREALAIVRELDISNLGLVYDIFHDRYEGESLDIIDEAAPYIGTVHLAEEAQSKRIYLKEENEEIYKTYYDRLLKAGCRCEFDLECLAGDHVSGIKNSIAILKRIMEQHQ